MINFKQKEFAEFDAMREFYVSLMKHTNNNRNMFPIIDTSALLPILKGNNIVIERFVLSTSAFERDKYRMYLKIGAKVKMPDNVRLSSSYDSKSLGKLTLSVNNGIGFDGVENKKSKGKGKDKEGGDSGKEGGKDKEGGDPGKGGGKDKGGGGPSKKGGSKFKRKTFSDIENSSKMRIKLFGSFISSNFSPNLGSLLNRDVQTLLGDVVLYDKKSRTLVLEFKTIDNAIKSLNILPFGLNYKVYLLNC